MNTNDVCAVILAAGVGTRMESDTPKVLTLFKNKPLIHYVLDSLQNLNIQKIVIVVGYKKEMVMQSCSSYQNIEFIVQEEQLGTGHALLVTEPKLRSFFGKLLVACGDVPMIQSSTFNHLILQNQKYSEIATVLSTIVDDPSGYGRILRNKNHEIVGIIEHKDANIEQKNIQEINTGTYIFRSPEVFSKLKQIGNQNTQKEYYLPDLFHFYTQENRKIGAYQLKNSHECMGINSKVDLENLFRLVEEGKLKI